MKIDQSILFDLLTSIFAVAGWDIPRSSTFVAEINRLENSQLQNLFNKSDDAIAKLLITAGFNRGQKVLGIMTERLHALLRGLNEDVQIKLSLAIQRGDSKEISEILLPINGIGPKVIDNFSSLQKIVK